MKRFNRLLILAVLCLGGAASAFADPTVTISGGNGVFVLAATGFQSIGGAKITLNYDASTLANPRVSKGDLGSRATVWIANTNIPGTVIVAPASLQSFPESGVIATISFDLKGNPPGAIRSLTAMVSRGDGSRDFPARVVNRLGTAQTTSDSIADSGGRSPTDETVKADNTVPGDTTTPTASGGAATTTDTARNGDQTNTADTAGGATSRVSSRTGAAGRGLAELVLNGVPAAPAETPVVESTGSRNEVAREETAPASETPAGESANDATTRDSSATLTASASESLPQKQETRSATDMPPSRVAYQSVLEGFRNFNGQRTARSLSAIFSGQDAPGLRQEPAIALSDGVSRLRLFVALPPAGNLAPNFSLAEAKLVSLKPEPDGKWLLEVLPAKGSYHATVTVIQGGAQTVIPLIVAPPLPGGNGTLTESGFAQFLADRGTDKAPRFDLNGDGRRDYIDDYIFTANYLAGKRGEAGKRRGELARK